MAGNSAGSIAIDLTLNNRAFNNQVKSSVKSTQSAFTSAFASIGAMVAAAFAIEKVVEFGTACVKAASDAQAAWTGLNSIVQGTGNDFDVAHKFLTKFTQDGLVGIEDAATAYKNLLSRGYDTTQIENVMTALKDSAAFGRQSSYTLTQAIVSATEGLKNENSILVDNAGVTKNVYKMWEEYAKSIGTSVNNLTQQQKIQAEVNGIMKETAFQTGDAATYTSTFAGKVQVLKGAFSSMQIAIGKVVAPIVGLFIPVITAAINAVTAFFSKLQVVMGVFGLEFPDVVQKTSTAVSSLGGNVSDTVEQISQTGTAAKKAAKEVNRAFGSVDEINVISNKKADASSGAGSGTSADVGSAAVAITPTVAEDSAINTAVSATMQKVIDAFKMLENSLTPLRETIFAGLKWAYDNILVPLAKWTIGEVLPAFLKGLSGAIDILNGVIENLKPVFKWFWDTFLAPVAAWTGGIIVDVLNAIGDALKWIGNNEVAIAIVTGVAVAIGLVNGALAVYNAVGGIANGIMLIYNGIMAISAGVTSAFGAAVAFLTSPITLAVAAIAAIIAIVILLVKHWDEVKEVTINVWNSIVNFIKSGVEKVKEFLGNVINFVKNNWQAILTFMANPFAGAFKLLYDNCEGFKKVVDNVLNAVKTAFSNAFNSIKSTITNIWNGILNIFNKGGQIFSGVVDGVAEVFKKIVNTLISGINKLIATPFNKINSLLNTIRKLSFLGISPFMNLWSTNPLPVPQIPQLAQGGWVGADNPQLAIVGDNKREGEIIAPESKIREQVKQAIAEMGTMGQKFVMDLNLKIQTDDGRTIIKKINDVTIQDGYVSLIV